MTRLNELNEGYESFKKDWYSRSLFYKLTRLAYYYPLHWFRLNYYYYFDPNKYTTYKGLVHYVQKLDNNTAS